MLRCLSIASDIADHHETCSDAHARLQTLSESFDFQLANRAGRGKARLYRAFGVIFVGVRISETGENSFGQVLGDEATVALHNLPDASVMGGNYIVQVLRVQACRKG